MAFARKAMLTGVMVVLAAGSAFAQVSTLQPGATVFVTPVDGGPEVKGRLVEFGPARLTLIVWEQRLTMATDRVQSIDLHGDSLKNGAIIGASIYGGLALISFSADPQMIKEAWFLPVVLIQTTMGAVIGTAIDALHKGRTPLYRRTTTVGVAPMKKGLAVGVAFRF